MSWSSASRSSDVSPLRGMLTCRPQGMRAARSGLSRRNAARPAKSAPKSSASGWVVVLALIGFSPGIRYVGFGSSAGPSCPRRPCTLSGVFECGVPLFPRRAHVAVHGGDQPLQVCGALAVLACVPLGHLRHLAGVLGEFGQSGRLVKPLVGEVIEQRELLAVRGVAAGKSVCGITGALVGVTRIERLRVGLVSGNLDGREACRAEGRPLSDR